MAILHARTWIASSQRNARVHFTRTSSETSREDEFQCICKTTWLNASWTANYTGELRWQCCFDEIVSGANPGDRKNARKMFNLTYVMGTKKREEKGKRRNLVKGACKVQRNQRDYRPSKGGREKRRRRRVGEKGARERKENCARGCGHNGHSCVSGSLTSPGLLSFHFFVTSSLPSAT